MTFKNTVFTLCILSFGACTSPKSDSTNADAPVSEEIEISSSYFNVIDYNFDTKVPEMAEPLTYQQIYREKSDSVVTIDGIKAPAKGLQDFMVYIPHDGSSEKGTLYVNHETSDTNSILGDGGGGAVFELSKQDGQWQIDSDIRYIDFRPVGGTLRNCGGTVSPMGTILTCEEIEPMDNQELAYYYRDTSDFNGIKAYENMGWMVEVDYEQGKALRKLYHMGRFMHEDAECMPDGKTVYLTDDNNPAVFFKFVASEKFKYDQGQLYAYKQSRNGESGDWIELPMSMEALINAREEAMKRGATLFNRHEWLESVDGKIYITETGMDTFDWSGPVAMGASPANYFVENNHIAKDVYADPYGRILVFEPSKNKISVHLEGGSSESDPLFNFANPDGLTSVQVEGVNYLVIHEDLTGLGHNRVNEKALALREKYNEIYFLDLSIKKPTIPDLKRFMVGPRGCETTGGTFTPDAQTFFVSIQHPAKDNPPPFNKTTVIAVEGFGKGTAKIQ